MNLKAITVFILITLGVLGGVVGLLWQFGQTTETPIEDVAGEMRYKRGDPSTSSGQGVVLVEFSDFQCPACLAVQLPLQQILAKFEGKVAFVYRDFPLSSIHKNAQLAAQAAEAGYQQGKFWEMHDKLFAQQAEWSAQDNPKDQFIKYAKDLGMDEGKFATDLESQATKDVVANDLLAATRYGLTGTPTFFVNGVKTEFNQIETRLSELAK